MKALKNTLLAAMLALAAAAPAAAEDVSGHHQYEFDLGAGLMMKPRYPGSDEVIAVPFPLIAVSRFFVPGVGQVIDGDAPYKRFWIYPSFNFIGKRDHSDSKDLEGMKDVDWSLEVGLGAAYRYDWIRGFVELRQGFNGYSGQVVNFGADAIFDPTERLEFMVGPRAGWGSDGYMSTYFGITSKEAANSPVFDKPYSAGAGFNSVGIAATGSYELTEKTKLYVRGGWDRLIGDAGNSPIVEEGSNNQFYGGAGITYRFGFDLN